MPKLRIKIKPPWGDGPPPPALGGTSTGEAPQWEPNPKTLTVGEIRTGIDLDDNLDTMQYDIKVLFANIINTIVAMDDMDGDRDDDVSRNIWKSVDNLEISCYHAIQALNFKLN